jgi:Metallo-peptidase family M12
MTMLNTILRCLCLLGILFPITGLSQNNNFNALTQYKDQGGRFERLSLFRVSNRAVERSVSALVPEAQLLDLDAGALQQIRTKRPEALIFALPFQGDTLVVEATQVEVNTPTCRFYTQSQTLQPVDYTPALHYRGAVKGDQHSVVAFSVTADGVMGMVADPHYGNMTLGRMETEGPDPAYIFYPDADLVREMPFTCATPEEGADIPTPRGAGERGTNVGCVRMAWEADYALFDSKGSVQATFDWLTGLFNQVAAIYANEQINIQLSQVIVWTQPDGYPTSSSLNALKQFIAQRTSFEGDLAHLIALGARGLGGRAASIGGLCSKQNAYAYSNVHSTYEQLPKYSWTTSVVAHEIGHNLGSRHTHWCGWPGGPIDNCTSTEGTCTAGPNPVGAGTLMSYCHLTAAGIDLSKGFGPLPGNFIRNYVRNASCLLGDCGSRTNTCAAPQGFSNSKTSSDSTVLNWTSTASVHRLQWRVLGDSIWKTENVAQSPYTLKGLPKDRWLEVRIQAVCGNDVSAFSPVLVFFAGTCEAPLANQFEAEPVLFNTSAGLNFKTTINSAQGYIWQYRLKGQTTWLSSMEAVRTSSVSTLADTLYEYRLQIICLANLSSTWSEIKTIRTLKFCAVPTSMTVTAITTSEAQLNCTAPATTQVFYWQYAPQSPANAPWIDLHYGNNNLVLVKNLTQNTAYKYRAALQCANGQRSNWSGSATFTTLPACAPVVQADVAIRDLKTTSVQLSCTRTGITGYRWAYQRQPSAIINLPETKLSSVTIPDLLPNTPYDIHLSVQCADGYWSPLVRVTTLTTAVACVAVDNIRLSATPEDFVNVRLSCTEKGAVLYQWRYRLYGTSSVWTETAADTMPVMLLKGLEQGRGYEYAIRIRCSNAVWSNWSSSNNFNLPIACNIWNTISATQVTDTSARLQAQTGAVAYRWRYRLASANVWIELPETTTNYYDLKNLLPGTTYLTAVQSKCSNGFWSSWTELNYPLQFSTLFACRPAQTLSLRIDSIGPTSARIQCIPVPQQTILRGFKYTFRYKKAYTSNDPWKTLPVDTLPLARLTALEPYTEYTIELRIQCANGSWSRVYSTTFRTIKYCSEPSLFSITDITQSSARLTISSNEPGASFLCQFSLYNTENWTSWRGDSTQLIRYLTGLIPNREYKVRLRKRCANGYLSEFSYHQIFVTAPLCANGNIHVSNHQPTSVRITHSVTNARSYRWELYGSNRQKVEIPAYDSTLHVIDLTGLQAETYYELRCFIRCANGFLSQYSANTNFTTSKYCTQNQYFTLSQTNLTHQSVRVQINDRTPRAGYRWRYRLGYSGAFGAYTETSTTYIDLSGLRENSDYYVECSIKCGDNTWDTGPNIYIRTPDVCAAVGYNQLRFSNLAPDSVTATCTVTGMQAYEWTYLTTGETPKVMQTATPTVTLTNLKANRYYNLNVRLLCPNGSWSVQSNFNFTTPILCPTPATNTMAATQITDKSAVLTSSRIARAVQYQWVYANVTGGNLDWKTTSPDTTPTVQLIDLRSNEVYAYRLRVQCTNGAWSEYQSGNTNFRTQRRCQTAEVAQLQASVQNASTARLSVIANALGYDWQYRRLPDGVWVDVPGSNVPAHTLTDLQPNTQYAYRVALRCAQNDWSEWSEPLTFTTAAVYDDPCEAYLLSLSDSCVVLDNALAGTTHAVPFPFAQCNSQTAKDVWLRLQMPAEGKILLRVNGQSLIAPVVAVYTGTCEKPIYLMCTANTVHEIGLNHTPGAWVWVRIWGADGANGTFSVCASPLITNKPTANKNAVERSANPIQEALRLYPVPATDHVIIETNVGETPVEAFLSIISLNGQILWQQSVVAAGDLKEVIAIQGWQPGIYEFRLQTDRRVWRSKFVKVE